MGTLHRELQQTAETVTHVAQCSHLLMYLVTDANVDFGDIGLDLLTMACAPELAVPCKACGEFSLSE